MILRFWFFLFLAFTCLHAADWTTLKDCEMVNGDYAPGSATVVRTPNPEPVVEENVGLNTATAKELADLPMVTCGMAKQIIARRPYASTANL